VWSHRRAAGRGFSFFLAVCLLLLIRTPTAAQAIRGIVVDDINQTRVPAAAVRLVKDGERGRGTQTDEEGGFFLLLPERGEFQLEVSRLGYETTLSQLVRVELGDTVSVEFRVRPDAVLLDPITVVGRSSRGRNAFGRRQLEWDRGIFLTPAMIDSISPDHPAEVLKGLEKVDVRWGWGVNSHGMAGRMPSVRTVLGRGCLLYMVDFVPVQAEPWAAGDWAGYQLSSLMGKDIVAVEVYRSVLETPPELRRYTDQFRPVWNSRRMGVTYQESIHCGLVVFWTGAGW